MSHRRHDLAEMTALYLIPIVAIVIASASGSLVTSVLPNPSHQLWTLFLSYIFWGLGTPLSWIILTLYFLRMMTQVPLKREVIVSLLLPIGPLGLSGFAIISLGKLARRVFVIREVLPHVQSTAPGEIFYVVGFLVGVVLWSFAIIWFGVAVVMLLVSGGFPFNMGWWGFIFPVGA
jgi:tellurite resistance protein TehA-like permease